MVNEVALLVQNISQGPNIARNIRIDQIYHSSDNLVIMTTGNKTQYPAFIQI